MNDQNLPSVNFARRVFKWAGVYGIIVLLPEYAFERMIGVDYPPAITHPEYFYGFIGVGLAWQVAFLLIAKDPARFRPLMIPSILEKIAFGAAVPVLYAQHRAAGSLIAFSAVDLVLACLFLLAFLRTPLVQSKS